MQSWSRLSYPRPVSTLVHMYRGCGQWAFRGAVQRQLSNENAADHDRWWVPFKGYASWIRSNFCYLDNFTCPIHQYQFCGHRGPDKQGCTTEPRNKKYITGGTLVLTEGYFVQLPVIWGHAHAHAHVLSKSSSCQYLRICVFSRKGQSGLSAVWKGPHLRQSIMGSSSVVNLPFLLSKTKAL